MYEMREAEAESTRPSTRINPVVFYGSSVCIVAIALWAMIDPEGAAATIGILVGRISEWFGWFYVLVATAFLAYVVFLALSRCGKTKLGPEHLEPEFSAILWTTMLFAAGIGPPGGLLRGRRLFTMLPGGDVPGTSGLGGSRKFAALGQT